MNIRKIVLAAATIAALSPVISQASPDRSSADACARAFANSIAAAGAQAPAYKFSNHAVSNSGSALMDFYRTGYTMTLEARDPKSGAAVARATCSTNSRGVVTTLSTMPLDAKTEALATQF